MFKLRYLITVFLVVGCVQCGSYYPKDGNGLVQLLCGLKSDSTVTLNSSISYNITSNTSCLVNGSFNVHITASKDTANVSCVEQNYIDPLSTFGNGSTFGIGFVNTSVTIQGIFFESCGAYLQFFVNNSLNESVLNPAANKSFLPSYSAVFVFVGGNITFTDIHFHECYGFAAILINTLGGHFENVFLNDSQNSPDVEEPPLGSGMMLIFTDNLPVPSSVVFHHCHFRGGNFMYLLDNATLSCDPFHGQSSIFGAGGLTLHSLGVSSSVSLNISNTKFDKNFGVYGGGLLIDLVDTTSTYITISNGTKFSDNYNVQHCPGSSMALYMHSGSQLNVRGNTIYSCLTVTNTTFIDNIGLDGIGLNDVFFRYGAAYIGVDGSYTNTLLQFKYRNVSFINNYADYFASCLFVDVFPFSSANVSVLLDNLHVKKNQQMSFYSKSKLGLFVFVKVSSIKLNDNNTFIGNKGSVFRCYESRVYLNGTITFENNMAYDGPAFNVRNGFIYFLNNSAVTFKNNRAEYIGGVMYIHNDDYRGSPLCALQLPQGNSFSIKFSNNSAQRSGNLVYAYPAYQCLMEGGDKRVTSMEFYCEQLKFHCQPNSTDDAPLPFSSAVDKIVSRNNCICNHSNASYPGEIIHYNVSVLDKGGNYVYTQLHVVLVAEDAGDQNHPLASNASLLPGQHYQIIKENKVHSIIEVGVTGYSTSDSGKLNVFFTTSNGIKSPNCPLHTVRCPKGFSLRSDGKCGCSSLLSHKLYDVQYVREFCSIDYRTMSYPKRRLIHVWIGVHVHGNNTSNNASNNTFALSLTCPIDFCTSSYKYTVFYIETKADQQTFYLAKHWHASHIRPLCQHSRTGVMCGECPGGLSVVFGTSECKECSNWWLWTIILYIVAGPLLICIMYVLRLSLKAGTLNGIIFFAQIANVGILDLMMYYQECINNLGKFSLIFISLLNLNLGFPMCFFDGMDELWKTGLSLIFPVYLVLITLIMITISHFSSNRFSNRLLYSSVQILATVVHLSLSKLLIITIDVFTPVAVHLEDHNTPNYMWYRNGSESFGFRNGKLISLMAVTTLVTGLFLVPYVTALFGGKLLIKTPFRAKYFRLAYESIHAPYREKRRYWFASRFLLQISLYLVYAIFRATSDISLTYFISLPLLMAFLIIQVYLRPYKSKGINILDLVVMLITVIMYIISWYMILHYEIEDKISVCMALLVTLIFVIFVLFLCVIGYHFMVVTTFYQRITALCRIRQLKAESNKLLISPKLDEDSFYRSCDRDPVSGYL